MVEWEDQQAELKKEKDEAGEEFIEEHKEWEEIVAAPFKT